MGDNRRDDTDDRSLAGSDVQPLEGINVLEFTQITAGPVIGKLLSNCGATSVHVESHKRPDPTRTSYPMFMDNEPGVNRSGGFAMMNDGKYGVTINLSEAEGRELAYRIATEWADIVLENFRPGVLGRMGLGYEDLRDDNPRLIYLSSSNLGQTGRFAKQPGMGTQLTSLSGFNDLTGYGPDESPQILSAGPYTDVTGVYYGFIAVIAALVQRETTGEGQFIDVSQYETALQFLAPVLLQHRLTGRSMSRDGNKSPSAAPHEAYPCRGEDEWCVISVHSDEEWWNLCEAMDRPDLVEDERFASHAKRKDNENELDELVAAWTRQFTPEAVQERLQASGVKAAKVNAMSDVLDDPQLNAWGSWWVGEQEEVGEHKYASPPFGLSKTPFRPGRPDPLLGEHNEEFFVETFGLSRERYETLVETEVIY